MSGNPKARIEAYVAAIAALAEELVTSPDVRLDVNEATGALNRMKRRLETGSPSALVGQPQQPKKTIEASSPIKIDDLSASEAAVELLKHHQRPMAIAEIVQALTDKGMSFDAERPSVAVATALARRANNYQDVVQIERGKWALTSACPTEELVKLAVNLSTAAEQKAEKHKERTKRGMVAARRRGVRLGGARKLNPESVGRLKRLLSSGAKTREACDAIGISAQCYYVNREKIEAWKEGDPWPPPARGEHSGAESDAKRKHMRLVKA